MPTSDVRRILDTGYLVVLDEAYFEFADADGQGFETMIGEVAYYPNLVVLRTFSKWAGLAGLRIGYGVFPEEVSQHLWKLKPPFNVNVAALQAMQAALDDRDHQFGTVRTLVAERDRLIAEFPKTGMLKPYPSRSNFILSDVIGMGGAESATDSRTRASWFGTTTPHRLRNCIRISVGQGRSRTNILLDVIRKMAGELGL